jgi:hypothetical protein
MWQIQPLGGFSQAIAPGGINYTNRANLLRIDRSAFNQRVLVAV